MLMKLGFVVFTVEMKRMTLTELREASGATLELQHRFQENRAPRYPRTHAMRENPFPIDLFAVQRELRGGPRRIALSC